ncbi:hypothetical protein KGF57_002052 [Candida theae]|uniref:FAD-binding FR-type domain-containing protein n=1 Tax=Candida theae TaxID=1198502 RepID=A0AAD5BG99_9ASCO|nr:uncharacterized protein KGF57_002052 [Candida theae]KAI5959527.1 hypothetical protein KGF57_002052 [Candida theae]
MSNVQKCDSNRKQQFIVMQFVVFITLLSFIEASNVPKANNLPCIRYKEMIPAYACSYQVNDHARYCEDGTLYKSNTTCLCNNINWLASVVGCLSCKGNLEIKKAHGLKKFCRINGGVDLNQEIIELAYQTFLSSCSSPPASSADTIIDFPICLQLSEVELYRKAYEKYLGNFDDSIYYGTAIYGYWFVVIAFAGIANWSSAWSKLCKPFKPVQRHLTLPAFATATRSQTKSWGPIQFVVPSRLEALVLAIFVILLIALTLLNTDPVAGDPIYYTKDNAQLRRNWYETFLVMHFVLGMCWLVGCWVHVNKLGFIYFYYPAAIVWSVDRLARIVRLVSFGFPRADVTLLEDDLIKIVIPVSKTWQNRNHLGYSYVYFWGADCFWQSHPFTFMHSPTIGRHMVCFCRVKGGVTQKLRNFLKTKPNRQDQIRVGVEGPYGMPSSIPHADSMVFIAGGTGVAGIYQEIVHCIKALEPACDKTIKLIWVVRNYSSIEWFQTELEILEETKVDITVHITGSTAAKGASNIGSNEEKEVSLKGAFNQQALSSPSSVVAEATDLSFIKISHGRPDIPEIVDMNIRECRSSVSFVTSGHPKMADDMRRAVCQKIDSVPDKSIHFYDQLQVWA